MKVDSQPWEKFKALQNSFNFFIFFKNFDIIQKLKMCQFIFTPWKENSIENTFKICSD